MSAHLEIICVDIGNSGLRCARLASAQSSHVQSSAARIAPAQLFARAADTSPSPGELSARSLNKALAVPPWSGAVLRIDWPLLKTLNEQSWNEKSSKEKSPNEDALVEKTTSRSSSADIALAEATITAALESWLSDVEQTGGERPARHWIVSSVQRTTEAHLRRCAQRLGADDYWLVAHGDLDLSVEVDYPERVGIDRLLAAQAALEHSPIRPLIVIQAGSAITVDYVQAPRRYCGGAIMPGVPMMLRLLSRAADLLPEVAADELLELPDLPGRNTAAAMSAGACSAVVGGVQHLIARYRQLSSAPIPVVLSGGDGPRLAPHLAGPTLTVDHLVLRGLAACAETKLRPTL